MSSKALELTYSILPVHSPRPEALGKQCPAKSTYKTSDNTRGPGRRHDTSNLVTPYDTHRSALPRMLS